MRLKDYLVRGKLPKLEESGRFEQSGKKNETLEIRKSNFATGSTTIKVNAERLESVTGEFPQKRFHAH